jgi:uroporphyrinogen-III decarboxylase
MYRQPDKILKAVERLTPLMIDWGTPKGSLGGSPVVMIPLHKGADGFMSDAQFKKFYWPSLKAVILGLIDRGLVPCLFAEGGYDSRLEVVQDLPAGKTIWYFDRIDLTRAKETVGKVACMMGNVPLSLLISGSEQDVRNYCENLIDVAGKGGGLIIATRSPVDMAKPENIRAMIETAKTYGKY